MPKQLVEISVDVPQGYTVVDYRTPRAGEEYILPTNGNQYRAAFNYTKDKCLILAPDYEFPAFIAPGTWYAEDANGEAWLFTSRPVLNKEIGCWEPDTNLDVVEEEDVELDPTIGSTFVGVNFCNVTGFVKPPRSSDWTQSLRRKLL